jgi:hypothetical protein
VPPVRDRAAASSEHHESFHARAFLGVGRFLASSSANGRSSRDFTGTTFSWSAGVGGNLTEGFVLGGAIQVDRVFGLAGEDSETGELDLAEISFSHVLVGPFLDIYVSPAGGFHFLGMVGISDLNVHSSRRSTSQVDATPDPGGLGSTFGVGYDAWVASELSVGGLVSLTYAPLSVVESNGLTADVTVFIPTLSLSATID